MKRDTPFIERPTKTSKIIYPQATDGHLVAPPASDSMTPSDSTMPKFPPLLVAHGMRRVLIWLSDCVPPSLHNVQV